VLSGTVYYIIHIFVSVTGEILKCIVIVDTLHRIEIETTTRLLYLEDSPEEMIVRGYDVEGNKLIIVTNFCCYPFMTTYLQLV
jgi:hypothetical protein